MRTNKIKIYFKNIIPAEVLFPNKVAFGGLREIYILELTPFNSLGQ